MLPPSLTSPSIANFRRLLARSTDRFPEPATTKSPLPPCGASGLTPGDAPATADDAGGKVLLRRIRAEAGDGDGDAATMDVAPPSRNVAPASRDRNAEPYLCKGSRTKGSVEEG